MTRPTRRPSKTALLSVAAWGLLGGLLAVSCGGSSKDSQVGPCSSELTCGSTCSASGSCAPGQYCAANNTCTAECIPNDSRCGSGKKCNSNGKCAAVFSFDAGVAGSGEASDSCVKLDVTYAPQIPTVIMLIDQSGSMKEPFDKGNRWNVLRDALINPATGIISTLQSKVRFGLALYTSDKGFGNNGPKRTCPVITEVPPTLNNFMAITNKYKADDWKGDTPTGESVDAAVKILDAAKDEGPKVIVLATDGEPDSCTDPNPNSPAGFEAARQLSVTSVQNAFKDHITTFVISVGNEVGEDHLRSVANAGQGMAVGVDKTNRFYRANSQADLAMAFDTIVGGVRSCVLALNGMVAEASAGSGTVILDGMPLTYNDANGWRLNSPTMLELQGTACSTIKNGDHALKIDFPCGVIIPIVPK